MSFGEQPSAAKWNILGTNDAAFNNGTGIPLASSDSATVSTGQTTTSTSYTDLATSGPAVTVTVGTKGKLLIVLTSRMGNNTGGSYTFMSYTASGANTISASDNKALYNRNYTANDDKSMSWVYMEEGLTTGSTIITAKYRIDTGTGTFTDRRLSVLVI